jgi:hypothetical protein
MMFAAEGAFIWFARSDMSKGGGKYLSTAFGIDSNLWLTVALIIGGILSITGVSTASALYYQYTGRYYTQDRGGFARSGGQDLGFWSGFIIYILTIYLFSRFIPGDWLGFARPFALLIIAVVGGNMLAHYTVKRLYNMLFQMQRSEYQVYRY